MAESLQVVVSTSPVTVQVASTPQPVAVAATVQAPTVQVAAAAPPSAQIAATQQPQAVNVEAVTRLVPGTPGNPGPAGANAEIVVLTLAAYLALSPAVQMDGRWYVIPKS
jgi:hypothetical protein